MNKKVRVSIIILVIVMFFLSVSIYFFYFNKEDTTRNRTSDMSKIEIDSKSEESLSSEAMMPTAEENEYYSIYIKQENEGLSFIPKKLNPGFKDGSSYNIYTSFDDDGNIINSEKIIEIDNFVISNQNKKEIKKIAGVKNYDEVLKEIKDVLEIEKNKEIEESKE